MILDFFPFFFSILPEFFIVVSLCFLLSFYSAILYKKTLLQVEEVFFSTPDAFKTLNLRNSSFHLNFLLWSLSLSLLFQSSEKFQLGFFGGFTFDTIAFYGKFWIIFFLIIFFFNAIFFAKIVKFHAFEFPLLVTFGGISLMLLIQVDDFLMLYLCLELQSLIFYVLAAFQRSSAFSTEAGIKYFVIGAFASGILLFGISLLYGYSGTSSYEDLARMYSPTFQLEIISFSLILGFFFVIVTFCIKLAAAPWHLWSVDVYEGSPLISVLFFSTLPKISLLIALIRLLFESFFSFFYFWQLFILFTAVSSIIMGTFGAYYQRKIKRFFVFSSVSHVGYILLGVACGTLQSVQSVILYVIFYVVIAMLNWFFLLIVVHSQKKGVSIRYIDEINSLFKENVVFACSVIILFFSIAGIPPLVGFFIKLNIFFSAVSSSLFFVIFFFIIFSVIGCFYYLRVIKNIFFDKTHLMSTTWSRPSFMINISKEISYTISFGYLIMIITYFFPSFFYMISYQISLSFFI